MKARDLLEHGYWRLGVGSGLGGGSVYLGSTAHSGHEGGGTASEGADLSLFFG